jgi:hypothetical protein
VRLAKQPIFRVAVLTGLSLLPTVSASDENSGKAVGLPMVPCSKIIELRDDRTSMDLMVQWTYGFWTGWNFANDVHGKFQKNVLHASANSEAIEARILAYCYEKHDELLFGAATDLFMELPDLPN